MPKKYDYTLKVGKDGSQRLALLNELINPHSLEFLDNTTSLTNKRILEVGCGLGLMAAELAEKSMPNGSVLATDISTEQLELAKKTAERSGVSNMAFKQISAYEIDQLNEKFDIIYLRFVLGHLPNAVEILQKIILLMHSDSLLICEEIETVDTMYWNPPDAAITWWRAVLNVQIEACKGNFTIGKDLPNLFAQNNLITTNTKTVQPVMNSPRLKQQLWMGVIEISPILIASGFATQAQIDKMIVDLKAFADSPLTTVSLFALRQIAGKKADVSAGVKPVVPI